MKIGGKDPLPPGNDEVEIPGLGIKKTQTQFIPPLPTEDPPASIETPQALTNEDKFQTYLQQTQMIAQNAFNAQKNKEESNLQTRATPVITPGFQFRPNGVSNDPNQTTTVHLTNQKDPVPFLIKPAMSKKLQPQNAPSYIVVKPQKPTQNQTTTRVHPFADKIEQLFSNASTNQTESKKTSNANT